MGSLEVHDVENEQDWARFGELPAEVYLGDARHVHADADAERATARRAKFAGRQRVLITMDGGRCAARCVARLSPTLADGAGRPVGMVGFFEATDEPDAVAAILETACRWLRSQGAGEIVGPMDGDTWHRYRFNVGPFERPLFAMEPYNRPEYGPAWERCGFEPLQAYFSKAVDDVTPAHAALAPRLRAIGGRGYRLRPIDLDRYDDELRTLHALSCDIFAGNYLYDPIDEADFLALYRPVRPLVDPSLVWFATCDGEPVGFVFAYLGGDTVNIKSLGVVAAHRRAGLGAALMGRIYQTMVDRGLAAANLCLFRDGNPSGDLEGGAGRIFRRYLLYRYALP